MRKLVEVKGIGEVLAAAFAERGFHSVRDIAEATEAELATVPGVSTARATQLISSAKIPASGLYPTRDFVSGKQHEL